jgi:hypothetical protein
MNKKNQKKPVEKCPPPARLVTNFPAGRQSPLTEEQYPNQGTAASGTGSISHSEAHHWRRPSDPYSKTIDHERQVLRNLPSNPIRKARV